MSEWRGWKNLNLGANLWVALAVGPDSRGHLVFVATSNQVAWHMVQDSPGGRWGQRTKLFGGRKVGAIWYEGPALAVGPDGRAHVVMEPKDNSGIRYQGQVMQGGSPVWRDNYTNLGGTALSPRVAVGPDNSVHIAHRGEDKKAYYGVMRSGFSGWRALQENIHGAVSVAVGPNGRAHVAMRSHGGVMYRAQTQTHGSWGFGHLLGPDEGVAMSPYVAVDHNNKAHIFVIDKSGRARHTVGPPAFWEYVGERFSSSEAHPPALTIDTSGKAHSIAFRKDGSRWSFTYGHQTTSAPGQDWAAWRSMKFFSVGSPPFLAIGRSGRLHALGKRSGEIAYNTKA